MTTGEDWTHYVRRITHGLPRKDIASAAGIHVSGVSRWLTGTSRPSPDKVIAFARSLHQNALEALVAAGYLSADDITGAVSVVQSLDTVPSDTLLDELRARLLRHDVENWPPPQYRGPTPPVENPQNPVERIGDHTARS